MVYRVCFRKLGNQHDAEDASQAVFMALVKKSGEMRWRDSLAGWLHTVARQTSLFMARTRARHEHRNSAAAEFLEVEIAHEASPQEKDFVMECLDDELSNLSRSQREAVVLRYLHGFSEREAAAVAGCAPNTLSCRASEGIARLRQRLVKRGCTLGVPALIGLLATESQAAVPETLIPSLMAVPKTFAAGAAAGHGTGNIVSIMEGTMKVIVMTKVKTVGIGVLAALLLGVVGVVTW
jgi:RNA polymerase sigma factor (sigma-70 family)